MIKIEQLKVESTTEERQLQEKIAQFLKISKDDILNYRILKRSIDARKKPEIFFVYALAVSLKNEKAILKKYRNRLHISEFQEITYLLPRSGEKELFLRPVIIGSGPAGLFCAYLLAQKGYQPIVLERGSRVEKRTKDVADFWETGVLNTSSNVQFGEGGAGTFSDGKLNTLVKDKTGRNRFVLETFVTFGAPEQILWDAKPHIGTDVLVDVIRNMRNEIIRLGGEIRFDTQATDFTIEHDKLKAVRTADDELPAEVCVLAIGHSARDTFQTIYRRQIAMSAKEFAVGLRIEHPQNMIDEAQYGIKDRGKLPASPYKLTAKTDNGRGVYSFCMCPGGYVVNASSLNQRLVVNGMSYEKRDSHNANSAIVVSVGEGEFRGAGPLRAIAYQEELEKKAYALGRGKIPQQLFGDFAANITSKQYGDVIGAAKGSVEFANLNELFSDEIRRSFLQGMEIFGKKIKDFDRYDAVLSAVESRTSSPVRIHRNEHFESNVKGIFPCGEGAGYAGGIMSAAMDGMKTAEEIIKRYRVTYEQ